MICVYVGRAKTVEPIDMQFVLWTRGRVHEPCHRLRGSASTVLTVTGFVNGKGQYLTPQNPHSLIDHQKFVASDYFGDPCGCAKFGANPSTGGFWANG